MGNLVSILQCKNCIWSRCVSYQFISFFQYIYAIVIKKSCLIRKYYTLFNRETSCCCVEKKLWKNYKNSLFYSNFKKNSFFVLMPVFPVFLKTVFSWLFFPTSFLFINQSSCNLAHMFTTLMLSVFVREFWKKQIVFFLQIF